MSFYWFALSICKAFVYTAFRFRAEGQENLPKDGGFILCCNHRTYLDPLFVGAPLKHQLTFMAKEELFKVKVLGPIVHKLGAFPVARGKGDTGAMDFAVKTVEEGKVLALFPEGTRSKDGKMLKFKSGVVVIAGQTKGTIVPACIDFTGKLVFRRKVTVRYGKPIDCHELHLEEINHQSLKEAREMLSGRVAALLEAGK